MVEDEIDYESLPSNAGLAVRSLTYFLRFSNAFVRSTCWLEASYGTQFTDP